MGDIFQLTATQESRIAPNQQISCFDLAKIQSDTPSLLRGIDDVNFIGNASYIKLLYKDDTLILPIEDFRPHDQDTEEQKQTKKTLREALLAAAQGKKSVELEKYYLEFDNNSRVPLRKKITSSTFLYMLSNEDGTFKTFPKKFSVRKIVLSTPLDLSQQSLEHIQQLQKIDFADQCKIDDRCSRGVIVPNLMAVHCSSEQLTQLEKEKNISTNIFNTILKMPEQNRQKKLAEEQIKVAQQKKEEKDKADQEKKKRIAYQRMEYYRMTRGNQREYILCDKRYRNDSAPFKMTNDGISFNDKTDFRAYKGVCYWSDTMPISYIKNGKEIKTTVKDLYDRIVEKYQALRGSYGFNFINELNAKDKNGNDKYPTIGQKLGKLLQHIQKQEHKNALLKAITRTQRSHTAFHAVMQDLLDEQLAEPIVFRPPVRVKQPDPEALLSEKKKQAEDRMRALVNQQEVVKQAENEARTQWQTDYTVSVNSLIAKQEEEKLRADPQNKACSEILGSFLQFGSCYGPGGNTIDFSQLTQLEKFSNSEKCLYLVNASYHDKVRLNKTNNNAMNAFAEILPNKELGVINHQKIANYLSVVLDSKTIKEKMVIALTDVLKNNEIKRTISNTLRTFVSCSPTQLFDAINKLKSVIYQQLQILPPAKKSLFGLFTSIDPQRDLLAKALQNIGDAESEWREKIGATVKNLPKVVHPTAMPTPDVKVIGTPPQN